MAKSYEREIRHVARENGDQQVRIADHAAVKERVALFGRRGDGGGGVQINSNGGRSSVLY